MTQQIRMTKNNNSCIGAWYNECMGIAIHKRRYALPAKERFSRNLTLEGSLSSMFNNVFRFLRKITAANNEKSVTNASARIRFSAK